MKKIILLAFVAIAMMACKSPEQKMAEACLREHLKCPSTLRVVAFTMEDREAKIDCDTIFHVARINGKKYSADEYYYNVKSVTIDSVRTVTRSYPSYKMCTIKYDAQNLMGAMVREEAHVVIENGAAIMFDSWFSRYYNNSEHTTWKESRTITDLSVDCRTKINSLRRDCWANQYDLQRYKWKYQ